MSFLEIALSVIIILLAAIVLILLGSTTLRMPEHLATLRTLRKSNEDSTIAGVCAGFGKYTPIPAWVWRAAFLTFAFCGGFGVLAYIILALSMPKAVD